MTLSSTMPDTIEYEAKNTRTACARARVPTCCHTAAVVMCAVAHRPERKRFRARHEPCARARAQTAAHETRTRQRARATRAGTPDCVPARARVRSCARVAIAMARAHKEACLRASRARACAWRARAPDQRRTGPLRQDMHAPAQQHVRARGSRSARALAYKRAYRPSTAEPSDSRCIWQSSQRVRQRI